MSIIQEALKKAQTRTDGRKTFSDHGAAERGSRGELPGTRLPGRRSGFALTGPWQRISLLLLTAGVAAAVAIAFFIAGRPGKTVKVPATADTADAVVAVAEVSRADLPAGEAGSRQEKASVAEIPMAAAASTAEVRPFLKDAISQRPDDAVSDGPDFVLNGVMSLEGEPRAIINNAMVELGDEVDGARVVKIEKRSVLLRKGETEITLNLK